jgi:hypothetical protein
LKRFGKTGFPVLLYRAGQSLGRRWKALGPEGDYQGGRMVRAPLLETRYG